MRIPYFNDGKMRPHTNSKLLKSRNKIVAKFGLGFEPRTASALTIGSHVFFRDKEPSLRIKIHEKIHVNQYAKHGIFGFLWIYFVKERNLSYREKTFEKEAFTASGEI